MRNLEKKKKKRFSKHPNFILDVCVIYFAHGDKMTTQN